MLQCTCPSKTQDPVQSPHEGETTTIAPAHFALTLVSASCFLLPKIGGVTVLQSFRQTTRKVVTLRARAPAELATALKSLAVKRDVVLSHVVREALATGAAIMLEAEDKTEVPA